MAKRRREGDAATPGKPLPDRVEQRSQNDQSSGGYDPEDYHAEGPVPVGNSPIHPSKPLAHGIPEGAPQEASPVPALRLLMRPFRATIGTMPWRDS
jgi:hypothetical protein